MKFLTIFLILQPLVGNTQVADTLFEKQMKELSYLIQSNLPSNEDKYIAKSSEYFIFDLTLDSNGNLLVADLLCKENSANLSLIKPIKLLIQKNWKPIKIRYSKIFIPLIFIFFNTKESEFNNISGSLAFSDLLKNLSIDDRRIFIAKKIVLYWTEVRK